MIDWIEDKIKYFRLWFESKQNVNKRNMELNTVLLTRKAKKIIDLKKKHESIEDFKKRIQREVDKL